MLDWAKLWCIRVTRGIRIAKLVSAIQDGHQGSHLEILQTSSPKPYGQGYDKLYLTCMVVIFKI